MTAQDVFLADCVSLPDGRVVHADSEAYRAACEAWWLINNLPGIRAEGYWTIDRYLDAVEKNRGKVGRDALWADVQMMAKHINQGGEAA